jgi:hypothetical protein
MVIAAFAIGLRIREMRFAEAHAQAKAEAESEQPAQEPAGDEDIVAEEAGTAEEAPAESQETPSAEEELTSSSATSQPMRAQFASVSDEE